MNLAHALNVTIYTFLALLQPKDDPVVVYANIIIYIVIPFKDWGIAMMIAWMYYQQGIKIAQ